MGRDWLCKRFETAVFFFPRHINGCAWCEMDRYTQAELSVKNLLDSM